MLDWTQVQDYVGELVPERPAELQAMEEHAKATSFPIIGPATGAFCYLVARILGARRIFELGSGFGYSTAWFARAVDDNGGGEVFHVVWDDELSRQAHEHLETLELGSLIRYRVGEAVQTLRETPGPFDLIFNDINKEAYPDSLPVIRERLRPGGVMLVDNVLWSGRIFDDADDSAATQGVRELTRRVFTDPGWAASIVPLRDGLLVARKT
jgi:predicted O-methyltransferase YrrM